MFSDTSKDRASELGIDLEQSYRFFLLEVKVGGPSLTNLIRAIEGDPIRVRMHSSRARREIALTRREREVLLHYAAGGDRKSAAAALEIEPNTVYLHLRKVRKKLGAKDAREAVEVALSRGLIDP